MPARQVGEAAVDEDVAGVAAARIDVTERANPVRARRRKRENRGAHRRDDKPHVCLDVKKGTSFGARHNAGVGAGYVGILSAELHFPEAGSLKGKRKYVKSAKAQLQNRFGVAVAEVDHHELWQRSRLTMSCVTREYREAERLLDEAERYLSGQEFELVRSERDVVSLD